MNKRWIFFFFLLMLAFSGGPSAEEFNQKKAKTFLKILLKHPSHPYLFERVYSLYAKSGKVDSLISALQKQMASTKDSAPCVVLGKIYQRQFQFKKALEAFEKANQRNPNQYILLLGKAYGENGQNKKAIEFLTRGEKLAKNAKEKREALTLLGKIYLLEARRKKALKTWAKILKVGKITPLVLTKLLRLYESNDFYQQAIDLTKEVIRRSQDNLVVRYRMKLRLAKLYEKTDQASLALALYREILKNTAKGHWLRSEAQRGLFALYRKTGKMAELEKYYRGELTQKPTWENHLELAKILDERGDETLEKFLLATIEKFPSQKAFYELLLHFYEKNDQILQWMALVKKFYRLHPRRVDLVLKGCGIYLSKKEVALALSLAKILEKKHGQKAFVHYQLARLFQRFKRYKEALVFAEKGLGIKPGDRKLLFLTGKLHFQNKEKEKALLLWRKLVPQGSRDIFLLYELSRVFFEHKFYKEAVKTLDKALKENPLQFKLLYLKALCLKRLKKNALAMSAFRQAYQNARSSMERKKVRRSLIEIYARAKLLDQLIEEFQKALAQHPKQVDLMEALAEMYLRNRQNQKALKLYEAIVKKAPKNLDSHRALAKLYALEPKGRFAQQAIQQYLELARLNPTQKGRYFLEIGHIHTSLFNRKKALEYYEKARHSRPLTGQICYELAQAYRYKLKKIKTAIELYKKAIDLGSKGVYHFELAELYRDIKKYELALKEYKTVAQMETDPNLVQDSLAKIFECAQEVAWAYRKKKEFQREKETFQGVLAFPWKKDKKRTLLCLLIRTMAMLKEVKLAIPLIQKVLSEPANQLITLQDHYSLHVRLFCREMFRQLGPKGPVYYEKQYGLRAEKKFKKAGLLKGREKMAIYKQIIQTYPFSSWAGQSALNLARSKGLGEYSALDYYSKILKGFVVAKKKDFFQALIGSYKLDKKRGQGKKAFLYLSSFADKFPALKGWIQKEQSLYPQSALPSWQISPPLTIKWKRRIATRFQANPIFSKNKVYYPKSDTTLLCYTLQGPRGMVNEGRPLSLAIPSSSNKAYRSSNYLRYYQGCLFGNIFIYGGENLIAYDLAGKTLVWKIPNLPEKVEILLKNFQILKGRVLGRVRDTLYFKDSGGAERAIPLSEVAKIRPRKKKNSLGPYNVLYKRILKKRQEISKLRSLWRKNSKKATEARVFYKKMLTAQRELRSLQYKLRSLSGYWRYRKQVPTDSFYTQPVLYEDKIFVYEAIHQWLLCFQAKTGRIIWMRKFPLRGIYGNINNQYNLTRTLSQYQPQMKVANNTLYLLADQLYGLSLYNGRTQWKRSFTAYGSSTPQAISLAIIQQRLYVSLRQPRPGIYIYDFQGKALGKKYLPNGAVLVTRGDRLCALTSQRIYVWVGKDVARLTKGASLRFGRVYLQIGYYLQNPTYVAILDKYIYFSGLGWLQIYRHEKGKLRLIWEDQKKKSGLRRPSSHRGRYGSFNRSRYSRGSLKGPYFYRGTLYLVDSASGNLYAYSSIEDEKYKILAMLKKNPRDVGAYLSLADLYLKGKQPNKARKYYKKVLAMASPSSAFRKKARSMVYQIYFQEALGELKGYKLARALKNFQQTLSYDTTTEERTKSIVFLSWVHQLQFQAGRLGQKLIYQFSGLSPSLTQGQQDKVRKALQGYLSTLDKNITLVFQHKTTAIHPFIESRISDLILFPSAKKVYEKLIYAQAYAQYRRATSPGEFLEIYRKFPLSNAGVEALKQAGLWWKKHGDYQRALRLFSRLKEILESHTYPALSRGTAIWMMGKLSLELGDTKGALDYFYILEHNYIFRGKALAFDLALADQIVRAQEKLAEDTRLAPPLKSKWSQRSTSYYYRPTTRPVLVHNKLFSMNQSGQITIYDGSSGKFLKRMYRSSVRNYYSAKLPLVALDNLIFCAGGTRIRALDGRTNKWLWKYEERNPQRPLKEFSFTLKGAGSYLFALSSDGYLYSFVAKTGKLIWKQKVASGYRGFYLNGKTSIGRKKIITYTDQYPFLLVGRERVALLGQTMVCFEARTGKRIWKTSIMAGTPSFQIYQALSQGQYICFADTMGNQYAISWKRGVLLWRTKNGTAQPALLSSNTQSLISLTQVGRNQVKLEVIELYSGRKKLTTTLKWANSTVATNPTLYFFVSSSFCYIFYDKIYVYDLDEIKTTTKIYARRKKGVIYTLVQKPKFCWASKDRPTHRYYRASPPLVTKDRIYIIEANGYLYAYEQGKR